MTGTAKTIEDFPIGTRVVFDLDGITVHGTVESAQLQKNLVDVKIYEPGHRSHCLIVSRAPETLHDAADDDGPSSYADLQRRVEGESKIQSAVHRLLERVEAIEKDNTVHTLTSRVASLETLVTGLTTRVTELEVALALEPKGGNAASA